MVPLKMIPINWGRIKFFFEGGGEESKDILEYHTRYKEDLTSRS